MAAQGIEGIVDERTINDEDANEAIGDEDTDDSENAFEVERRGIMARNREVIAGLELKEVCSCLQKCMGWRWG